MLSPTQCQAKPFVTCHDFAIVALTDCWLSGSQVNTYENSTAVIFDVITYEENPLLTQAILKNFRTKELRDQISHNRVARWVMHIAGERAGTLDEEVISSPAAARRNVDFVKINPNHMASHYCLFWGVEWRHDDQASADPTPVHVPRCCLPA